MPSMWVALEMWKYTAFEPCTGWVRTIGCSTGLPYLSRSSGRVVGVPVQAVERRERLEASALALRKREIRRAHARHARAAAGRRDLHPVQDGGGGRTFTVGMVGVPLLGRLLAVPVPDQADHREVRHVVL